MFLIILLGLIVMLILKKLINLDLLTCSCLCGPSLVLSQETDKPGQSESLLSLRMNCCATLKSTMGTLADFHLPAEGRGKK